MFMDSVLELLFYKYTADGEKRYLRPRALQKAGMELTRAKRWIPVCLSIELTELPLMEGRLILKEI